MGDRGSLMSQPSLLTGIPADELAIMRERARAAARTSASGAAAATLEVLELQSRGQVFAVPLAAVEGIIELTTLAHVPRAPPFVRGYASFRGDVLLAVELGALMEAGSGGFADLRRLVALHAGGRRIALLSERDIALRTLDPQAFHQEAGAAHPFVVGTSEDFVSLLEPEALIVHVFRLAGNE